MDVGFARVYVSFCVYVFAHLCLLICSVALNSDRCRWFAEFLDNLGDESVCFVCHPAAMSLTPATKQGCAMRALALADNRVVRTALTTVGQLHRETA